MEFVIEGFPVALGAVKETGAEQPEILEHLHEQVRKHVENGFMFGNPDSDQYWYIKPNYAKFKFVKLPDGWAMPVIYIDFQTDDFTLYNTISEMGFFRGELSWIEPLN